MHDWQDWRKNHRHELIAKREAVDLSTRQIWSQKIDEYLAQNFHYLKERQVAIYWPFKSEYDPRPIAAHFSKLGANLALPEVVKKNAPLSFRQWTPDTLMKKGAYGIPTPDGTPIVTIDALIIPMVGFDQNGYRLGYGSGYFDRTLATFSQQPLTIGVAFEIQRLANVHPQSHDIAMQYIVTEAGVFSHTQR